MNTVNKRVIGYLAEEEWTGLAELNEAIAERVHEVNHELRRVDGTTRFERFTTEEAPVLCALPMRCSSRWNGGRSRSGATAHVTTDYQHYSVPHALAGRLLQVRLTSSRVTVFDGHQVIAEHQRKKGRKGQYSTDPAHVPVKHREVDGLWS